MDISVFATRDNSEEGQWFQVEAYGRKLPFELKIRGSDSDAVQQWNRRRMKSEAFAKAGAGKFADMSEADFGEMNAMSDEAAAVRIAGIRGYRYEAGDKKQRSPIKDEPVALFGRELKNDMESYLFLVEQMPAVRDFVLAKSGARENFLSSGRGN